MRNTCCTVLNAADTSSQTGGKINANQIVSASFHIFFGDVDAAGTVKLQASNDCPPDGSLPATFTPVNWVDIPNQSVVIASGASALLTVASMAYYWVRVVYTRTGGGSTTIKVNMNALSV